MNQTSKRTFITFITILTISCKSKPVDPRPSEQLTYLQTVTKLQEDYKNFVGNEVSQDEITRNAKNFLNEKISVREWVGTVQEVGKNENVLNDFYGKKYVTVSLFPYDLYYAVENDIKYDAAEVMFTLYNIDDDIASSLRKNQRINFSCNVIKEKSITNKGAIERPEVVAEAIGKVKILE